MVVASILRILHVHLRHCHFAVERPGLRVPAFVKAGVGLVVQSGDARRPVLEDHLVHRLRLWVADALPADRSCRLLVSLLQLRSELRLSAVLADAVQLHLRARGLLEALPDDVSSCRCS